MNDFHFKIDMMSLFKEINANMIATDQKYNIITHAHNAISTGAVGLFITKEMQFNEYAWGFAFVMSAFSAITIITQDRFQWWKDHYLEKMANIWKHATPKENITDILPRWLTPNKRKRLIGADITMQFFPFCSWIGWLSSSIYTINPGYEFRETAFASVIFIHTLLLLYYLYGRKKRS